jgi:hypothetical protein
MKGRQPGASGIFATLGKLIRYPSICVLKAGVTRGLVFISVAGPRSLMVRRSGTTTVIDRKHGKL